MQTYTEYTESQRNSNGESDFRVARQEPGRNNQNRREKQTHDGRGEISPVHRREARMTPYQDGRHEIFDDNGRSPGKGGAQDPVTGNGEDADGQLHRERDGGGPQVP